MENIFEELKPLRLAFLDLRQTAEVTLGFLAPEAKRPLSACSSPKVPACSWS
jgi:hypothetical protein